MDPIQKLREDVEQWKEKYNQAKKQKTAKYAEKLEASDTMEEAEKKIELLTQEVTNSVKRVKEEQANYKEAILKLEKKNDDLKTVFCGFQQRLDKSRKAYDKVQDNVQVKGQLLPSNINFVKEAPGNQSSGNPTDISYTCYIMAGHPYVLEGGQALLTFEEEQVARAIIRKGIHAVEMDDKMFNVTASEPQLDRYVKFEVKINISNKTIQVSDLPTLNSEETLKDKVELAFYKSAMGGGEIEAVDYDRSKNTAYVTYLQSGVPLRVLKRGHHCIMANGVLHDVEVKPCIDAQLDKLQTFSGISRQSVLLTGIKDISEEEEEIQDLLQIHFQRTSSGGGEVEAIVFSQEDKKILLFQEDLTKPKPDLKN